MWSRLCTFHLYVGLRFVRGWPMGVITPTPVSVWQRSTTSSSVISTVSRQPPRWVVMHPSPSISPASHAASTGDISRIAAQ